MALPSNNYHEDYRGEDVDIDPERIMEEVVDELHEKEFIDDVRGETGIEGVIIEVEYNGSQDDLKRIESVLDGWGCSITKTKSEWVEIRCEA